MNIFRIATLLNAKMSIFNNINISDQSDWGTQVLSYKYSEQPSTVSLKLFMMWQHWCPATTFISLLLSQSFEGMLIYFIVLLYHTRHKNSYTAHLMQL